MDPVDLHITFVGTQHGLEEGRLSIASFGNSLIRLLQAYRRIASGIVKDALPRPGYGNRGGKYAREAAHLDFELSAITHESPVTVVLRCRTKSLPLEPQGLFPEELLTESGQILLNSIELESRGQLRNAYVRRYLESLPPGIAKQEYRLSRNANVLKTATVSQVQLAEQTEWPALDIMPGNVVGVGFDPGNSEVRVKAHDGGTIAASALPDYVEKALSLRGTPMEATIWREPGKKARLIGIVRFTEGRRALSHSKKKELLFQEWDEALRRLAR